MPESARNPTLAEISHAHGEDQSGHLRIYRRVFLGLAVFTALEYFCAHLFKNLFVVLVLGLTTLAVVKALMVALYFMHLRYEGRWVYLILLPAAILAVVLVAGLIPDIAFPPRDEKLPPTNPSSPSAPEPTSAKP